MQFSVLVNSLHHHYLLLVEDSLENLIVSSTLITVTRLDHVSNL